MITIPSDKHAAPSPLYILKGALALSCKNVFVASRKGIGAVLVYEPSALTTHHITKDRVEIRQQQAEEAASPG